MAKKEKWTPELEVGDIFSLYELRKQDGDESRIREFATLIRQMCRMENEIKVPGEYQAITKPVRTPFMRDNWHRITSSLVAKTPILHITPKNDKREDYRDSCSIAERAALGLIKRINKERGSDIIYNLNSQLVRDGASVLNVVHRPSAWANFPLDKTVDEQDDWKKSVSLPIALREVDRLSMVFEGGEYGDEWVIEYGEYSKSYLASKYGMIREGDNRNGRLVDPANIVEGRAYPEGLSPTSRERSVKIQYFDAREWHIIIDGSEVPGWPKPNPYAPYLPYFRANTYESESLLYSLIYLVPRLDEALTMKINWAFLGAYPNPVLETVPNSQTLMGLDAAGVEPTEISNTPFVWSPGKMIDVPLGKTFKFVIPPGVGKDINDLAILFKSLIDIAGIPSIMRGMSLSGDTGYLANQQMAAASMSYNIAAMSSQRQLEQGFEFCHWLVSNIIRQKIFVLGWNSLNKKTSKPSKNASQEYLGLSPNEYKPGKIANLTHLGDVEIRFRPILPTDEQARAMIAMQVTNSPKPLMSRYDALDKLMQEEDPDGILERLRVEDALDQEPLKSIWTGKALEKAGIIPSSQPNPASQLVSPSGQQLIPPGPTQLQDIPLATQNIAGGPTVRGINQPIVGTGGRPAGVYPGQPGGPGNG